MNKLAFNNAFLLGQILLLISPSGTQYWGIIIDSEIYFKTVDIKKNKIFKIDDLIGKNYVL